MDNAVRGLNVSLEDRGLVDEDTTVVDVGNNIATLDSLDLLAVAEVSGLGAHARDDVVGQDLDKLSLVGGLEEMVEDTGRELGEGLIGGSEHSKVAWRSEGGHEVTGLEGSHQSGKLGGGDSNIDNGTLSGLGLNLGHELGGNKNLIDGVDNTVAGLNVGSQHLGVVNEDIRVGDGHGDILALDSLDLHTVAKVSRLGSNTGNNVVGEDVDKLSLVGGLEEVVKNGRWDLVESLVGRSKHSEGTGALERGHQAASLEGSHQGGQIRGGNSNLDNVLVSTILLGKSGGQQNLVDLVNNSVRGHHIGKDNLGVVDEDLSAVDVHGHILALDGLDLLAVAEISRLGGNTGNDVVGEDVDKLGLVGGFEELLKDTGGEFVEGIIFVGGKERVG